jgi:Zn finger protein HypA/HybF involved in hydrogenase expression
MLCCPACGKPAEVIVQGRELEIHGLEIEELQTT